MDEYDGPSSWVTRLNEMEANAPAACNHATLHHVPPLLRLRSNRKMIRPRIRGGVRRLGANPGVSVAGSFGLLFYSTGANRPDSKYFTSGPAAALLLQRGVDSSFDSRTERFVPASPSNHAFAHHLRENRDPFFADAGR
jgi:hypothetical protein